jgi:hypothetical protein
MNFYGNTIIGKIAVILCCSLAAISGCRCSSCSSGAGDKNNSEVKTQKIIPVGSVLSSIQKKIINRSNEINESGFIPLYKVEKGGRLFVTGSDVYYIKNGDIAWQSSPARKYQKLNNRYYVATGDYVFCAMKDGTVIWKTGLVNIGTCEIRDGVLFVSTGNGEKKLNLNTGKGTL